MHIIAGPGASALAAGLARALACEWSELAVHRFPDGESGVRITADVHEHDVVLACSLDQPEGKTLPLLFAADAARELGARSVGLCAPYLAYMRQDARFNPGEAITSRSYARLLSGALDYLVTVDPHLHRWKSLDQIYRMPTRVVAAAPAIAEWVRDNVAAPVMVGPDSESEQWVAAVAGLCGAPWTVLAKTRRGDDDVSVKLAPGVPLSGRTPVLLDDIISTGHTLAAAAAALRAAGFAEPVCIGVHALFAQRALERLQTAGMARIITCDTVEHATNAIPLTAPLAVAIQELIDEHTQERPGHPGPP
jgi:ribose-phosphate pyrophosphokinase